MNKFDRDEIEMLSSKLGALNFSNTMSNLLTGFSIYIVFANLKRIGSYLYNLINYPPGTGVVKIKNSRGFLRTDIGIVSVPLVKMPSFDLDMGFISEETEDLDLGIFKSDVFQQKNKDLRFHKLNQIKRYWVTDVNRPEDFKGREIIHGYIYSHLDEILYVFRIEDNNFIDYQKIVADYEKTLELYETSEEEVFEREETCCVDASGNSVSCNDGVCVDASKQE